MIWLPCPKCGDDNTYRATASPVKACRNCGKWHAVGRQDGGVFVLEAAPGKNRFRNKIRRPQKTRGGRKGTRRNTERRIRGKSVKYRSSG